ncbi:T-complex protein 11 homolog [Coregonus clupeaformis]|uniref:T-complex protein 11 homolog n=1 Tax=Coregonus clupeaformis TaxID=59861 RepID=UPI001BE1231B|nr:T-complex protein 11 homolog [Coregonus clupeaformis]
MYYSTMLSLLLPGHVHLRAQVEEVLDLIQQQADHGALDLQRLSGYIINTMASLCAPIRDPKIRTLQDLSDPVELLKVIFRVLGLIKADMVNFTVQSLRPHLLQQAVQYEQAKFQEILLKQSVSPTFVLNRAYLRLLSWDPNNQTYPETVLMDRARLEVLEQRLSLLVLQASVLLLNSTQCGATVFSSQGFVCKLKQTITALLEGSHNR